MNLEFELLTKDGFIKFDCNSTDEKTLNIAQSIGKVAICPEIAPVQTLIPKNAEFIEKSSYSGNFGMGVLPLHTDMAHWYLPPHYFLLRCIRPAKEVLTNFLSVKNIIDCEDPIIFKRALFRPRRRIDDRLTILRLWDNDIFRWDALFIQPINNNALDLQKRVKKHIENSTFQTVVL